MADPAAKPAKTEKGSGARTLLRELIYSRRSVRSFTEREPTAAEIAELLDAVCQAPNHRMTEPWRFHVLGPEARAGYGRALGLRKAKRAPSEERAREIIAQVEARMRALPCMVAVAIERSDNPEIHEEDYAATFMGLQNLSLLAHEMGLGTHLKTGAVMNDPRARAAVGLPDAERVVAIVEIGEPADLPEPRPRRPASEATVWTT